MLSWGTVHSIGGKEIGCCWSDPSCSITAVPGPALTLTFSRGQPTVTDRPHCESFNRLTVASLKITETQVPGSTVAVAQAKRTTKRLHLCLKLLPLLQGLHHKPLYTHICKQGQYKLFSTAVLAWPYSTTVLASGKWPKQAEVRNNDETAKRIRNDEAPSKRRKKDIKPHLYAAKRHQAEPLQPLQQGLTPQAYKPLQIIQALYRPSTSKPFKQYRSVQA